MGAPKRKKATPKRTSAKRGKSKAAAEEHLQKKLEKSASATTIDDLPDEMIQNIMTYLALEEKKTTRRVCKRWHAISYSPNLIQNDCLHIKDWADLNHISQASRHVNVLIEGHYERSVHRKSQFWDDHGRDIKSLTLNHLELFYPVLPHILSCCPNVESLVMVGSMSSAPFKWTGRIPKITLSKLQYLQFDCVEHTLDVMRAVFRNMPQLETLFVCGRYGRDREAKLTLSLVERTSATLKELTLSMLTISNYIFREMINIVGPQLTGLSIAFHIDDSKVNDISEKCSNLQRFCSLTKGHSYCVLSKSALQRLLTCLNHSTHISLRGITLDTCYFPAAADRVDNLIAINLTNMQITADILISAFSVEHPKLERIILDGLRCVNGEVLSHICPNLPNLTHFSLNHCAIIDGMLQTICTFNKKLKFFAIEDNFGLLDALTHVTPLNELTELIFLCFPCRRYNQLTSLALPNLRWIKLSTFDWTTADICNLIENCPLLYKIESVASYLVDSAKEILAGKKRASCSFLRPFSPTVPTGRSEFPYHEILLDCH